MRFFVSLLLLGTLTEAARLAAADPPGVAQALAALKSVGKEGAGNDAAGPAWKALVAAGSPALLPTLSAFDDATPAAANWLRPAADAIAEGEKKAGRKLPAAELEAFVLDVKHSPAARRVAFELLVADVPAKKGELLPKFLNDPSLELRRDAVASAIESIEKSDAPDKPKQYFNRFPSIRDVDQVEEVAKRLDALGIKVDVTAHFGFVTRWHVAGPFESTPGEAITTAHPPEKGPVDLKATYPGKGGAAVGWKPLGTGDKYAMLDLNKQLAKHKNAAVYAHAVIEVAKETPAEVRAGSQNAVQIWVNGAKAFEREEYHHGTKMDQHAGKVSLKAGRNELLVKVCQNDQKEEWAQVWGFQLRVCDATGGAVPFAVVSPTAAEAPAPPAEPAKKPEGK